MVDMIAVATGSLLDALMLSSTCRRFREKLSCCWEKLLKKEGASRRQAVVYARVMAGHMKGVWSLKGGGPLSKARVMRRGGSVPLDMLEGALLVGAREGNYVVLLDLSGDTVEVVFQGSLGKDKKKRHRAFLLGRRELAWNDRGRLYTMRVGETPRDERASAAHAIRAEDGSLLTTTSFELEDAFALRRGSQGPTLVASLSAERAVLLSMFDSQRKLLWQNNEGRVHLALAHRDVINFSGDALVVVGGLNKLCTYDASTGQCVGLRAYDHGHEPRASLQLLSRCVRDSFSGRVAFTHADHLRGKESAVIFDPSSVSIVGYFEGLFGCFDVAQGLLCSLESRGRRIVVFDLSSGKELRDFTLTTTAVSGIYAYGDCFYVLYRNCTLTRL